MPVIGITGGVGTGKSTLTRLLANQLGSPVWDADAFVHELFVSDQKIIAAVTGAFGEECIRPDGSISRAALREQVFQNSAARQTLEAIVHPPVHERRRELSVAARESGEWLCLDIPLLYESCSADDFDRVVVVACSEATQLRRLCELRLLPKETAAQMIRSQLPLADKVIKSDHLIWNDGPLTLLHGQSCILASALRARFPR